MDTFNWGVLLVKHELQYNRSIAQIIDKIDVSVICQIPVRT